MKYLMLHRKNCDNVNHSNKMIDHDLDWYFLSVHLHITTKKPLEISIVSERNFQSKSHFFMSDLACGGEDGFLFFK